jgi:hypothetical protein
MVRWRYRGTTVLIIGLLLAAFAFAAVTGCAVLESAARAPAVWVESALPGEFVVRHPLSDPPAALFAGDGRFSARPLASAPACLALLRGRPEVASVLPFSLEKIEMKTADPGHRPLVALFAVAMADEDWLVYRARLSPGAAGLPVTLAGGIVLGERAAFLSAATGRRPLAPGAPLFLDRPGAGDRLNLAAAAFAGSFAFAGAEDETAASDVCFVSPALLRRASWRSLGDVSTAAPAAPRPAPRTMPAVTRAGAGHPLTYPFLFSLRSAAAPAAGAATNEQPAAYPAYLLVSLDPAAAPRRDAVLAGLQSLFERERLAAVIEPWDPAALRSLPAARRLAAALALAAALLLIVMIANAALRPVLHTVLPEDDESGGFGLDRWRPSFFSRGAFIALTGGAIGTLAALAALFAYNHVAPPALREGVASAFGAGTGPLEIPWTGPAAAGAGVILFALLATLGPRRRARRIIRLLTAEPEQHPAPSAASSGEPVMESIAPPALDTTAPDPEPGTLFPEADPEAPPASPPRAESGGHVPTADA